MKEHSEAAKEALSAFLNDRSAQEYRFSHGSWNCALLKSAYDEDTDFLYLLEAYGRDNDCHRVSENAEYAGVYSHARRLYCDPHYTIKTFTGEHTSSAEILREFCKTVSRRVEELVQDKPVPATPEAKEIRDNRDYFLRYGADSEAAERFFDGLAPRYKASFGLDSPPTRIFVQILNHPDAAAEQFARAYIRENANAINERVWQLGVVREKLAALEQTPGGHHLRRAIRHSLEGVDAKSVRLELLKDGKPLKVRIAASELLHTGSPDYATWNMDAPSRKAFAQLYGRDARLFPQDIVRILHGRNVLYDAVNNPVFQ